MIKAYCDICQEELEVKSFRFEATVDEIVADISNELPTPQKKLKKTVLHSCENCYKEKLKNLFKTDGKK